jgi:hypothetical protein
MWIVALVLPLLVTQLRKAIQRKPLRCTQARSDRLKQCAFVLGSAHRGEEESPHLVE